MEEYVNVYVYVYVHLYNCPIGILAAHHPAVNAHG